MIQNDNFFVRNILASTCGHSTVRTMHMRYPRYIHAELMTHRVFSRNARSSRAVPNSVLLQEPIVEPMVWGLNQKGMQSQDELTGFKLWVAKTTWRTMAKMTRVGVRVLNWAGLHKQWSNRPLEWFGSIDVLVTSVYWENFLVLRDHSAAMPEIQHLAKLVRACIQENTPAVLGNGEWHLPFANHIEGETSLGEQKILSIARCARISYVPFDGAGDITAERQRYHKLMGGIPIHATPAEHQCTPDTKDRYGRWRHPELHGNLHGWIQCRKEHPMEFFNEYNSRSI